MEGGQGMKQAKQLKFLALFLILTLSLMIIIIVQSNAPMHRAKKQATQIAKDIAKIERTDEFYWFTRDKTYFTVIGQDDKNQTKVVFIPQDGSEAVIIDQKNGVTDSTAIQEVLDTNETTRIKKISLGMIDNKAVWEVVAESKSHTLNYYLVDFKEGHIVETLNV